MLRKLVIGFFSIILITFGILLATNSDSAKEKITKRLHEFLETFNKGDINNLSSFLTEDAVLTKPVTGETIEGREAIVNYLQDQFQKFQGKEFVFNEGKVEFPESNLAIVQGVLQIIDHGNLIEKRARKVELVEENEEWYLDSISDIDIEAPPSQFEYLKDLSWLIGDWKDEDEHVTIHFSTHWDKYKNFIIQNFGLAVYSVEELEGIQIIGWDPIEKKIRSWVFDSDGGFGSAVWSQEGKSWHATMRYTLSDGRKASSINIYTPLDANSFTYSSVGRDIDGEILSNIEPVTVVKEK